MEVLKSSNDFLFIKQPAVLELGLSDPRFGIFAEGYICIDCPIRLIGWGCEFRLSLRVSSNQSLRVSP